ncbi:LysR family transcriptional regulator [Devosia lacusdianchii]|uniref:LysR family transcriptional regulator n=1 Tax=Devosia lacusdianchii TaxID=2917991 RepID=UPI001F050AED|nr:LysR family transcriptional regulator [Devosia sp. JXJ CY 41]
MTLEQLRIFLEVADQQHITRAAEALNMTQSAVSAAIAALENRHGVKLFDRVGRSIVLNPIGSAFRAEARSVLDRARSAENALDDLSGLRRGRLSVMASQTIASYWLPQRLVAFRRAYPQVELDLGFTNTNLVADGVQSGRAELGLVEWLVERPTLSTTLLGEDEMVVVVGTRHEWAGRLVVTEDLGSTRWVVRESGSGTRAAFDGMMQRAGVAHPDIALELPGNEALLGVVEAGLGATLLSRDVARAHIAAGLLSVVDTPPVRRSFYILRHKERHRTRAAEAFLSLADA